MNNNCENIWQIQILFLCLPPRNTVTSCAEVAVFLYIFHYFFGQNGGFGQEMAWICSRAKEKLLNFVRFKKLKEITQKHSAI